MSVDVPKKLIPPVDSSTVRQVYGRENPDIIKPVLSRGNISQSALNSKNADMVSRSVQRRTTYPEQNTGSVQRNAVPVQNHVAEPVQRRTSAPKRRRAAASGQALIRGQKWTVTGNGGNTIHKMRVCVGWEQNRSGCELDMSAFMLAQNEKVLSDDWFVFYGQEQSPDGSVKYCSNSDNFSLPDDAELSVSLDDVYPSVQKILVCVTIYEASERHHNFGMVRDLYARILDDNGRELVRYCADNLPPQATALVLGELYRYNGVWKFNAVGSGYNRDLSEFCRIYGVELE
ncbi:MAG: TerD family protein [Ruminococcus sp.]|nr:TerD family protein [Ruminococcus sp.]MDE6784569.1 TerD family protein [Ruminococcus sp.]